jgi:hypothetical protein
MSRPFSADSHKRLHPQIGDLQMTQQITITLTEEQTRAIIREFSSKVRSAQSLGFFESAQLYSEIVKAMTQAQSEVAA